MSEPRVPAVASVRLDAGTREALGKYMEQYQMTFSQAVRTLLALSLREEVSADEAFRAAAWREGVSAGAAKLAERVQDAIKAALGDMGAI